MSDGEPRPVVNDDSLLASVAGVPLTRMARIGLCFVWAGFWAARIGLTDALQHFNVGEWKSTLHSLLGESAFDQGFSLCMAWLTIEVTIIAVGFAEGGIRMLIAKTPRGLKASIVEGAIAGLSPEDLEAIAAKKRKAQQEKAAKENAKEG